MSLAEFSKPVDEKKFRCQWARIFLTYKTKLDKEMVRGIFRGEFAPKEIWIAHENGDSDCPYEHTHIYVDFGRPFNTRDPRKFDIEGIHPNIRPVTSRNHTENIRRYMAKEDKENVYLLEPQNFIDGIWRQPTIHDALRMAKRPSDVPGIIAAYRLKPEESAMDEPEEWRPWQKELLEYLDEKPNDRTIVWIIDKTGGQGKTFLSKYLMATGKAYVVSTFGGMRDAATIIAGAIESGWDKKIFIADLPRTAECKAIYEPLEAIKNGLVTSTKYSGKTMVFRSPHLVVFANFPPFLPSLSMDRWAVAELVEGRLHDV